MKTETNRETLSKKEILNNWILDDYYFIDFVINYETYLQNTKKYKLGAIVTQEELRKYFKLLEKKNTHRIFQLW